MLARRISKSVMGHGDQIAIMAEDNSGQCGCSNAPVPSRFAVESDLCVRGETPSGDLPNLLKEFEPFGVEKDRV
jgi:hypothetical protein